jgi:hypothetical protein
MTAHPPRCADPLNPPVPPRAFVHRLRESWVVDSSRLAVDIGAARMALRRTADGGGPADCRVSADPVALLLVAYGRTSQWKPVLTGKLVAWGRKPWLGRRFVRFLVVP